MIWSRLSCLLLLVGTAAHALDVDLFINWNGPRGEVVIANMNSAITGTHGSWQGIIGGDVSATLPRFEIEARTPALSFPVALTVSNVAVSVGTNNLRNHTDAGTPQNFLQLWGNLSNAVAAGFVKIGVTASSDESVDLMLFNSSDGFCVLNLETFGTLGLRAHSSKTGGASDFSSSIACGTNFVYFIFHRNSTGGWLNLKLYDPSNGYTLLGDVTSVLSTNSVAPSLQWFSGYLYNPVGDVVWGPMAVINEPTADELTALEPSLTPEVVRALIAASSDGDVIDLPAGGAVWTNGVSITNKAITLRGNGTWITNNIGLNSPLITARNAKISGINFVGTGATPYGDAVRTTLNANGFNGVQITNCFFQNLREAVYMEGFGLVDHCGFLDNWLCGRNSGNATEGGNSNWTNYYPIAWNSTNYSFWEDNNFTNNHASVSEVFLESSSGAAYVARFNHFYAGGTDGNIQTFDAHGDQTATQKGTLGVQWYGNTSTYSGGAYSMMYADYRGGQALIYSNTITGLPGWSGATIQYRIEAMWDASHNITNAYVWANTSNNGLMGIAPGASLNLTTNNIFVGTHIFTNAPAELSAPPYPHPVVAGMTPAPDTPTTPAANTRTHTISGTINIGTLRRAQ